MAEKTEIQFPGDSGAGPIPDMTVNQSREEARMAALREISDLATAREGLGILLDRIVHLVCDLLSVRICSLMLLEPDDEQTLRIHAAIGLSKKVVADTRVKVGKRISGRVVKENRTILIENVEGMPEFHIEKSGKRYVTKSLLSVPIRSGGKAIGVLNINNKTDGSPFDESDRNLLETICNQAGLAIENAHLLLNLIEKNQHLLDANNDLARLNEAKNELLVTLSHEFRTPLTIIEGYAELISSFLKKGQYGKFPQWTGGIHRQIRVLDEHLVNIFDYFTIESGEHDWSQVQTELRELLCAAREILVDKADKRSVTIKIGKIPRALIRCHRLFLVKAFIAVLDNAVRFTAEGSTVEVKAAWAKSTGRKKFISIQIKDHGVGIRPELADCIFEDFKQTDNVFVGKPDGLGIGLSLARSVLIHHGGSCRLAETSPEGTTFELLLPAKRK